MAVFIDSDYSFAHIICLTIFFSKWKSEKNNKFICIFGNIWFYNVLISIGIFFNTPLPNPHNKISQIKCEIFWHIKIEIYIFGKIPKIYSYKNISQFTKQTQGVFQNYLIHEIILRLNCAMGYFDAKIDKKIGWENWLTTLWCTQIRARAER